MDRLNLERLFVAIMQTGSFVAAAGRLGVSSGQASKMLSRLEVELGVQLIKRSTRALSPTEIGQTYYERIKVLLEEREALDALVGQASGRPSGRLRITAPMSFGCVQLVPALLAFAELYPDVQLDVSFADRLADLVDEGFDVAVRIGHLSDSGLIARKLCEARLLTVASADYIAAHGAPQRPEDLAHHACIIDTNVRNPNVWTYRDPAVDEAAKVAVRARLVFSDGRACVLAAERNLGVARLPSFIAGEQLRRGKLMPLLERFEPPQLGVHVMYPPARHLAVKVRTFAEFLVSYFSGEPDWDQGW